MAADAPPTWDDVRPLFASRDVSCMRGRGLRLDDYDSVKLRANDILASVTNGEMPPGGWEPAKVETFRFWVAGGCLPGASQSRPDPVPTPTPQPTTGEVLDGLPGHELERSAFHKLVNIEDNRAFEPTARKWAQAYLAAAQYDADPLYGAFLYTVERFRARMKAIYDQQLPMMHQPHPYDGDTMTYVDGRQFRVGPFSDAVVKDRILQLAPFNLTDGVWLQHVVSASPIDEIQSRLFGIWSDEAGNGHTAENHANVYDALLKSIGHYLPPITDAAFLDIDVLPGAWRGPVFEMCVGLFPQEFFPELLGMTLFLEWEATPTMHPLVTLLEGRGMNPLFYKLHMGIDNISNGHGARAREAIEAYLAREMEEGGDAAQQGTWKRIWNGYVAWATLGGLGVEMQERAMQIDRKQINIGTSETPECWPDLGLWCRARMVRLVEHKAPEASQVHGLHKLGTTLLNTLFASHPGDVPDLLRANGYIDIAHPRRSRFFQLIDFGGPMYRVFDDDERAVILDWIESLTAQPTCVGAEAAVAPTTSAAGPKGLKAAPGAVSTLSWRRPFIGQGSVH